MSSSDLPTQPPAASGNATLALVLGLLGVTGSVGSCCCCLFAIPALCAPVAWYLGRRELTDIRARVSPPAGESLARAGMVCGIAGTVILILYALFIIGYIAIVGFAVAMEGLKGGGIPVT